MGCASSNPLVEGGKNIVDNVKETKDNAVAVGEKAMQDAGEVVNSGMDHVKHAVESGLNTAQNSIGTFVNSIENTISTTKSSATNAAENIANKTTESLEEAISDAKTVLVGDDDIHKDLDTLSTTATIDKLEDDTKHEFGESVEQVKTGVTETLHVEDIEQTTDDTMVNTETKEEVVSPPAKEAKPEE
ncbi:PREDICTED: uncharacterized protein LOC108560405 [Nicrophorus vespilloides]|uniref:Uncharacterized protein LOC108560405 n=1 Tax=Nicrophorus vespilloides TaxID=110193 RepID=A0ABM1MFS1_NICVS|nr:PREDICTED: uncharacterized protein LOC108560405 [Nicrophorus vespilloides]